MSNKQVPRCISKPVKTARRTGPNIFSRSPSSIWSWLDCHSPVRSFAHWELRNTSSHVCFIQYMQEFDSDEKVGNDESCHVYSLQIPFIPVSNACKLLMIPTVKWKQQIWLCQALSCGVWLLTACWGFTVGGTNVFTSPLSFSIQRRIPHLIYDYCLYNQSEGSRDIVLILLMQVHQIDVVSQSFAHKPILYSIYL